MGALSAVLLVGCLVNSFVAVYAIVCLLARRGPLRLAGMFSNSGSKAGEFSRSSVPVLFERLSVLMAKSKVAPLVAIASALDRARQHRRERELSEGMPDALRLLGIALDSGSTLVKALDYAAVNCNEPLASELKRAVWDLEAGQGFDEAMERLRARTGGSQFAYLAVAMEIQHKSGGSLSDVLSAVSVALRQSAELASQLQTKTSQGRLSARVVALMPLILLAVLSLFSPGYFTQFFTSIIGIVLLVLAVLLEITGVLLVRKTVNLDMSL